MNMQFPPMDDRELEARIKNLTRGLRRSTALAVIFFIFVFVGFPLGGYLGFTFIGYAALPVIALAAYFSYSTARYKKRLKILISNNIVRGVLSETFDLTHYAPNCHIGQSTIKNSGLLPDNWNRLSGSDMVEGFYKGVRFSFSDIHLEMVRKTKNGTTRTTKFKGQWLVVELAKVLPWSLQLKSRLAVGKRVKSDVETENMDFNKRFQIICRDAHTAFYILTPHFMEYILNAKHKSDSQLHMNFHGQQVHTAMHSGRDLFEPCGRKLYSMDNITALRKQMEWDVNYITSIIDELLLNENLFNTETTPPVGQNERSSFDPHIEGNY
ncbi:MAG: DUF3137 domain-containing protein [Oscillospiraceae bacterium]|nr:DUF3137 domain-containing protein [Oscillospiraceae bacterium]